MARRALTCLVALLIALPVGLWRDANCDCADGCGRPEKVAAVASKGCCSSTHAEPADKRHDRHDRHEEDRPSLPGGCPDGCDCLLACCVLVKTLARVPSPSVYEGEKPTSISIRAGTDGASSPPHLSRLKKPPRPATFA